MRNQLEQNALEFNTRNPMTVQIGLSNKEQAISTESHHNKNSFIQNQHSDYFQYIAIMLTIIMVLKALEIAVYTLATYRKGLKKKIIKNVSQTTTLPREV